MFNKLFRMFFPAHTAIEIVREYKIPEKINFKFQSKNGWIIATSPDLPGFVTEAKNSTELLGMLNDGILTYFDVPGRINELTTNYTARTKLSKN